MKIHFFYFYFYFFLFFFFLGGGVGGGSQGGCEQGIEKKWGGGRGRGGWVGVRVDRNEELKFL